MMNQSSDLLIENQKLNNLLSDLNRKMEEIENSLFSSKSAHEKDNALKDDQIEHYKKQSETLKKELADDRERFQDTILQLNLKKSNEKNKESDEHSQIMSAYESIYKEQLESTKEKLANDTKNYKAQIKELRDEAKEYKERISELSRELRNKTKSSEIELNKLRESEAKCKEEWTYHTMEYENKINLLNKEIEELKESKQSKIMALEDEMKKSKEESNKWLLKCQGITSKHNIEIQIKNDSLEELKAELDSKNKKLEKLLTADKNRGFNKFQKKGPYGVERSSSNFGKGGIRPSYSKFQSGYAKGQSSAGSSMCGSQKENNSRAGTFGSTFMKETLGKTTNFDQLSTNKTSMPLGRNSIQNNATLSQYESREEEED
jgi:chromosome segregation ATPase